MYTWVTDEQWLLLSIIGLGAFLVKFRYNESAFSKYNKILTMYIPVFLLMFIGSIMQILKIQSDYILIHTYITVAYGAALIGYIIYSGIRKGNVPSYVKLALFISLLSIVTIIIIIYCVP